jgi:hypothetical protein
MGYSVETTGQQSACQRRCVFSIIVDEAFGSEVDSLVVDGRWEFGLSW